MKITHQIGSKGIAHLFREIINNIPPIDLFIETFGGSGIISNYIQLYCRVEINDYDTEISQALSEELPQCTNLHFKAHIAKFIYPCSHRRMLFLDPPYPIKWRKGQRALYDIEMTDEEHIELLQLAKQFQGFVMICSNENPIYQEALEKQWRKKVITVNYHGQMVEEVLWFNYPKPTELLSYEFAGDNFTDRQRIKRKANRWIENLRSMDPIDRNVILSSIQREFSPQNTLPRFENFSEEKTRFV